MKKLFTICCIVASFAFIFAKPMVANAATKDNVHCSDSVSYHYVPYGYTDVTFEWDIIPGEEILFSNGYADARGLAISACTWQTETNWYNGKEREHIYKTEVYRGISVSGSVKSGGAGGMFSFKVDEFFNMLTCGGLMLCSQNGEFGD